MKTETVFTAILNSELCRAGGSKIQLPYAILNLCACIKGEEETDWELGQFDSFDLASFIVAAYWCMSEWHSGQSSVEYQALCELGEIYKPNMSSGVEEDSAEEIAYEFINEWYADELKNTEKLTTSKI